MKLEEFIEKVNGMETRLNDLNGIIENQSKIITEISDTKKDPEVETKVKPKPKVKVETDESMRQLEKLLENI